MARTSEEVAMRRILIALLCVGVCANATSTYESVKEDFFKKITPERQKALTQISSNDTDLKKAMDYLTNQANMLKMPEFNFHGQKVDGRYMPDCEKALPYLVDSFAKNKNSLSAYIGLYCINNDTFMKKTPESIKQKKFLAEGLYQNEKNLCMGYISYGDILLNGYAITPDPSKALKVFEESKLHCYRFASDWEKRVIETKIEQARFKLRTSVSNPKQ